MNIYNTNIGCEGIVVGIINKIILIIATHREGNHLGNTTNPWFNNPEFRGARGRHCDFLF